MERNLVKVADNSDYPDLVSPRFERKFVFEGFPLEDIIQQVVYSNHFGFREIYTRRSVNNIYFDDENFSFYKQNVSGDGIRKKYRLRWYGDNFSEIHKPTFEIKKKFGEVGDKISFKIPELSCNLNSTSSEELKKQLIDHLKAEQPLLAEQLPCLHAALFNFYERRYFLSVCSRYRITLDYNMGFYDPNFFNSTASEQILGNQKTILELKYETDFDDESRQVSQQIPVRLSKNSKYVSGIDIIRY